MHLARRMVTGFLDFAEGARQRHALWLAAVMRCNPVLPQIPVRTVADGGFDPVIRTEEGRAWAEAWWEGVLSRDDLDLPRD